jgi:hypothetical protein
MNSEEGSSLEIYDCIFSNSIITQKLITKTGEGKLNINGLAIVG